MSDIAVGLLAGVAVIVLAISMATAWSRFAEARRARRMLNLGDNDEGTEAHAFLGGDGGHGGFDGDGH
ncbi:hypothetical protein C3941_15575 [Kaistia algarum]|uniref:hypothetical protein n=1 Tax=Kaistia algarum TaxID=2083279 RepID=UPI000CE7EADC|nr:hypothetical protein [Kaistia algarum]MCX5514494.1 hypothetical protein [Kaistia algarum]PPE79221.1 hypothetical protein C3941_15575 [Kaistia algarum]